MCSYKFMHILLSNIVLTILYNHGFAEHVAFTRIKTPRTLHIFGGKYLKTQPFINLSDSFPRQYLLQAVSESSTKVRGRIYLQNFDSDNYANFANCICSHYCVFCILFTKIKQSRLFHKITGVYTIQVCLPKTFNLCRVRRSFEWFILDKKGTKVVIYVREYPKMKHFKVMDNLYTVIAAAKHPGSKVRRNRVFYLKRLFATRQK